MTTPLRLLYLAFALFILTVQSSAQDCSTTGRYTSAIFPTVTKSTAILFGNNAAKNYTNGSSYAPQDLFLDFYEPAGDAATKRPLVILGFGGGFISGSRTEMDFIATEFAKKGYTVASVDYRLINTQNPLDLLPIVYGSDDVKMAALRDVVIKAAGDMKAAVRYFKYMQATSPNTYRIDTTKIIIGGASAGAIAALHAAYIDNINEDPNLTTTFQANGGIEGNTDLPGHSLIGTYTTTGIVGVLNIAGAILDSTAIDSNDPAVYSAQGDKDQVIPYVSGPFKTTVDNPFGGAPIDINVPVTFYGAYSITQRAQHLGLRNMLFPIPDGNHESPGLPANAATIIAQSSAFMQSIVCAAAAPLPVTLSNFNVRGQNCAAVINWQTAIELQSSRYEVERSEDGVHFDKVASVQSRNAGNGSSYTYRVEGATKAAWYRLRMVDLDGKATYSPAQRLTPNCNEMMVRVFPNPAQLNATVSGLEANQFVDLISASGKLLWSQKAGGQSLQVPLATAEKGLLLIRVKDASGKVLSSTKLVKN